MAYLVNKPLRAAGMSADNVRGWEMNEYLAEKRSFEGKYEILRTISQPRTLSSNISASQKGVYLFYNPPIDFHIVPKPLAKSQCWSDDKWARLLRARWFERLNYMSTVIRSKLDRLWCKLNFCSALKYLAFFSASFLVRILLSSL